MHRLNYFFTKSLQLFVIFIGLLGSDDFRAQSDKKTVGKENLSGKWVLIQQESSFGLRDQTYFNNYIMEISIVGEELKIRKRYVQRGQGVDIEYLVFADGRGEKNVDIKSKTKWTGNKLERRFDYKTNFGWTDVSEEYSLTRDFKKLIFESKSESKMSTFQDNYRLILQRKD